MAGLARTNGGGWRGSPWRIALWGVPALLLLVPAVAMRFTDEVKWDGADFAAMAILLFTAAGAFDLAARATLSWAYRAAAAVAVTASFLIVWINLAVGMIGPEDDPYNLLFGGAIAVALIGAMLARFRPAGMARAMLAAGAWQAAVAAAGLTADWRGGVSTLVLAGLWLVAAGLFLRAGRQEAGAG